MVNEGREFEKRVDDYVECNLGGYWHDDKHLVTFSISNLNLDHENTYQWIALSYPLRKRKSKNQLMWFS